MRAISTLRHLDLGKPFSVPSNRIEAVGLEVEVGLIHRGNLQAAEYPQALALLHDLISAFGATPLMDAGYCVGARLTDGSSFTLETGGALEYSSPPLSSVAAAVADVRDRLEQAAVVAAHHNISLLASGIDPFTPTRAIPWNPKPRVQVMRDYFREMGSDGVYADEVMGIILSAQTSLDYLDTDDLITKLRLLVRASPIVAALFVNSPIAAGETTGALSRRMQYWRHFDPRRCGVLGYALEPHAGVEDVIEWAARLPMIYRNSESKHIAAPSVPFRHAVEHGFGDGTYPTDADWESHLSQVWPHVRVRHTLEMRLSDAPPWPSFGAGAALWTGIAYDRDARRAANELLSWLSASEIDRASMDVAAKGLSATIGPYLAQDLARELLRLSRSGLLTRVNLGMEPPTTPSLLDPIEEVCETMRTFADVTRDSWQLGKKYFLAKFSIPVD